MLKINCRFNHNKFSARVDDAQLAMVYLSSRGYSPTDSFGEPCSRFAASFLLDLESRAHITKIALLLSAVPRISKLSIKELS